MAKLTPAQFAEKLARRLSQSTEDIRRGVESVTENPMEKAANKSEKWINGLQGSVQKWKRGLARISLQDWQKAMLEKGLARVGPGVEAAKPKIEAFAAQLLPFQDALKAEVNRMPDVTLEDSLNRMVAWARGMAKFERN